MSSQTGIEPGAPIRGTAAGPAPGTPARLGATALALAREQAVAEAGDPAVVGEFLDSHTESDASRGDVVTARFAASVEGYRGWQWSVTMAVVDAARPTVSEVTLLPGPEALVAPAWVPWEQRVRSGDLGVADVLPTAPDDTRLVPAYLQSDDPAVEDVAHELGIGRARVLSRQGRLDAAERWHTGSFGPRDKRATHAPGPCVTCAFFLPLAGSLGAGFGVCGNEYSPADGHVVDTRYGCGAHSEATARRRSSAVAADALLDETRLEVYRHEDAAAAPEPGEPPPPAEPESAPSVPEADAGTAAGEAEALPAAPTLPTPPILPPAGAE